MKPFWGEHEVGDHPHMEVTEAIIGAASYTPEHPNRNRFLMKIITDCQSV